MSKVWNPLRLLARSQNCDCSLIVGLNYCWCLKQCVRSKREAVSGIELSPWEAFIFTCKMKNLKSKQWFNLTGCTFQTLLKKLWQWHWRCNPRSWSLLLKPFLWERKIKHVSQKSGFAAHGSQNQTSDDSAVVFKYRIEQCGCSTIWRLVQLPKPYWSQWNVDENVKTQIGCSVPAQMDHKGRIECSSPVSVLFSVHLRKKYIFIMLMNPVHACTFG